MPELRKKLSGIMAVLLTACLLLSGCGGKEEAKTVVVMQKTDHAPETDSWYGWWRMKNTSGDWNSMYGYWWDCCGEISADGKLMLWDEDLKRGDYLAVFQLEQNGDSFSINGGKFIDKGLEKGSACLEVSEDKSGEIFKISGKYDAVGKGGFDYEIFLRPWGAVWQSDADELPYYYEEWYLPLIKNGSPMPDSIG